MCVLVSYTKFVFNTAVKCLGTRAVYRIFDFSPLCCPLRDLSVLHDCENGFQVRDIVHFRGPSCSAQVNGLEGTNKIPTSALFMACKLLHSWIIQQQANHSLWKDVEIIVSVYWLQWLYWMFGSHPASLQLSWTWLGHSKQTLQQRKPGWQCGYSNYAIVILSGYSKIQKKRNKKIMA